MSRLITCCVALAMALCTLGCGGKQPEPPANVTIIPGTFSWDAATGQLSAAMGDLAWEQVSETTRNLTPMHGTRIKLIENRPFDDISLRFIKKQSLTAHSLSASDEGGLLRVGSVAVFRTSQGRYGKLRVEGFRSLHDFSFPEIAAAFSDTSRFNAWKSAAARKPNMEKYHLVVKWVLYP
jgi:hypothetical protein